MAKYYIRVGTVPVEAIQSPMDLNSLFTYFKSHPPKELNEKGIDSLVQMGYYETEGDEEMYSFFDAFFMVKNPTGIDFYLYKESSEPVISKPAPPKSAS